MKTLKKASKKVLTVIIKKPDTNVLLLVVHFYPQLMHGNSGFKQAGQLLKTTELRWYTASGFDNFFSIFPFLTDLPVHLNYMP